MKHSGFKIIFLIFFVCVTVLPAFSQEVTNDFETVVLDTFNGDSGYTWKVDASKFATVTDTVTYPRLAYVEAWPVAVFGYNRGANAQELRSLGINGRFDRRGYNWIDVYPTLADDQDGNATEIPIPGRIRSMDMWVWGSNMNYYIEVFLRDHQGVVHSLKLGDLNYTGWRNLRVNIPSNIPQSKRILPAYAGLTFVKFRIWTQPSESVDNFFIYFKQLKILTDVFEALFDGNELADPQHVADLWAN